jgi:hypothetical protein
LVCEVAIAFLHPQKGCKILQLLSQAQQLQGSPPVIQLIISALIAHLSQVAIDSIELPVLLRACEALGRFLVLRYQSYLIVLTLPLKYIVIENLFFLLLFLLFILFVMFLYVWVTSPQTKPIGASSALPLTQVLAS